MFDCVELLTNVELLLVPVAGAVAVLLTDVWCPGDGPSGTIFGRVPRLIYQRFIEYKTDVCAHEWRELFFGYTRRYTLIVVLTSNICIPQCPIPISMKLCGFVERAKIKDTYFCLAVVIQVLETLIEIDVGGFTNVFLASVHLPFKPRTEL